MGDPVPFPGASIIIPVHDNLRYTRACISALMRHTLDDSSVELIVVDNGSSDGTEDYLRSLHGRVKSLRIQQNLGFAKACNQGAAASAGEFLVFLNNDTLPHEGWLNALLDVIRSDRSIAVVGSKLLYPNGTIQHTGVVFADWPGTLNPLHIYAGERDGTYANRQRDFQAVTAACMLVRRSIFLELEGFDEAFLNSSEDVDFCLRVRARGYRVVFAPRSILTHYESKTPGRHRHDEENVRLLNERWAAHVIPDYSQYLEADGQAGSWKHRLHEASYRYSQGHESSGDPILLDLIGAPLFEKEVLSRRGIDLTPKMLSAATDRMVQDYGHRPGSRRGLEAAFFLALGNVYHAEGKRQTARHYLLVAIRKCPAVLFNRSCLTLGLKATAPASLILAARKRRMLRGIATMGDGACQRPGTRS
jgi:GT2 family glycosyltransferase